MARLKEYNRDQVLERATEVFWGKGYEATSVSDLVKATGLNSASMYKDFGNKDAFFEQVLENYETTKLEPFYRVLVEEPTLKSLQDFFDTVAYYSALKEFRGCLMLNSVAEQRYIGPKGMKRAEKYCVKITQVFENVICSAQRAGEIPKEKNPQEIANFILCFLQGISAYGRVGDHKKNIKSIVDMIKMTLK